MASLPKDPEEVHAPPRPWQEFYRTLLDLIPAAVFVADDSGRVIDANAAFCDRAGRERAELLSLSLLAMPGDRERCLAAGATDYLTKPLRLGQLLQWIQTLLSRSPSP